MLADDDELKPRTQTHIVTTMRESAARELGPGRYRVTPSLGGSTVAVAAARELELSQEHPSERADFVVAAGARVTARCRSDSGRVADDLELFGEGAIGVPYKYDRETV